MEPQALESAILKRMERLERENRTIKGAALLLMLTAGAILLMGQAPRSRKIEASEFVLLDSAGKSRGELAMAPDGTPQLVLYDAKGKSRASLGVSDSDGPSLLLTDVNARMGDGVMLTQDGLTLFHKQKQRATLALFEDGTPGLSLRDGEEKLRASLLLRDDGTPHMSLMDGEQQTRADLVLLENSVPRLSLSDPEGFETVLGSTNLVTPGTGEHHQTSAASIVLFSKDKKVLWSAP